MNHETKKRKEEERIEKKRTKRHINESQYV